MVYRALADAVVLVHFAFVVFVVVGSLLARSRPALVWLHLPALAWAVGIVTVGYECPLTALENDLRRLGGERAYPGGFVDHYIENVLYPQRLTPLLLTLAGGMVVVGYAGLLADRRRHLAWRVRGVARADELSRTDPPEHSYRAEAAGDRARSRRGARGSARGELSMLERLPRRGGLSGVEQRRRLLSDVDIVGGHRAVRTRSGSPGARLSPRTIRRPDLPS